MTVYVHGTLPGLRRRVVAPEAKKMTEPGPMVSEWPSYVASTVPPLTMMTSSCRCRRGSPLCWPGLRVVMCQLILSRVEDGDALAFGCFVGARCDDLRQRQVALLNPLIGRESPGQIILQLGVVLMCLAHLRSQCIRLGVLFNEKQDVEPRHVQFVLQF